MRAPGRVSPVLQADVHDVRQRRDAFRAMTDLDPRMQRMLEAIVTAYAL
jgi:hypothetical protein